jgi:hypothetical protein
LDPTGDDPTVGTIEIAVQGTDVCLDGVPISASSVVVGPIG